MIRWDSKTGNIIRKRTVLKILDPVLVGVILLSMATLGFSQSSSESSPSGGGNVAVSLAGGFAHSTGWHMLADLKAEIQFTVFTNASLGLGIGYLGDSHQMGLGGHGGGMMGGFSGHSHHMQVLPLTASLYYGLPVNSKVNVFMVGGGGYYLSSYGDVSTKREGAFGPHAGLGFDVRLAEKIGLVAERVYRFITFGGFSSEIHTEFHDDVQGDEHGEGYWHHHHYDEELHYHSYGSNDDHMGIGAVPFDMSLNGFSLRLGIKFQLN